MLNVVYEFSKFPKYFNFIQKKIPFKFQRNINEKYNIFFKRSLTFAASVDVNKIIYALIRESFYQYNK